MFDLDFQVQLWMSVDIMMNMIYFVMNMHTIFNQLNNFKISMVTGTAGWGHH